MIDAKGCDIRRAILGCTAKADMRYHSSFQRHKINPITYTYQAMGLRFIGGLIIDFDFNTAVLLTPFFGIIAIDWLFFAIANGFQSFAINDTCILEGLDNTS